MITCTSNDCYREQGVLRAADLTCAKLQLPPTSCTLFNATFGAALVLLDVDHTTQGAMQQLIVTMALY